MAVNIVGRQLSLNATFRAVDIEDSGLVAARITRRLESTKDERQNAIQNGVEERGANLTPEAIQQPRWTRDSGGSQKCRREAGVMSVEEKQF